jgi:carboxymethylenebutenolidase
MERKKASDYPPELLELFDKYVHGEMERRDFLESAKKFAVGGVHGHNAVGKPEAELRLGPAVPVDDKRIKQRRLQSLLPGSWKHQRLLRKTGERHG